MYKYKHIYKVVYGMMATTEILQSEEDFLCRTTSVCMKLMMMDGIHGSGTQVIYMHRGYATVAERILFGNKTDED
jgi:hypothetical protein